MTNAPKAVPTPPSYRRIYVSWHEQWTLARYVDHYLTQRSIPVSPETRTAVIRRIEKYPAKGALKKADMDYYLDQHPGDFTEQK